MMEKKTTSNPEISVGETMPKAKIWIDLDNTPHVPFFKPIIRELNQRGHTVFLTARDAFQVCEMAEQAGLAYTQVGHHYGKSPLLKVWGLGWRSLELLPHVLREKPALALSHGSRSQILLCNLLRIPTVMVMDYEHASTPPLVRPRWEIVLDEDLHCKSISRIRSYRGIKEDVYAADFRPDDRLLEQLGLDPAHIIVTVRPPANEAHYHSPESDLFFEHFMNRICATRGVRAVLLPRNRNQEAQIRRDWPQWFRESKVTVPRHAVDGLNLLWLSDLVVSGGGTMNREAAALGVPVYSIFRGKMGAVDRQLQREGRLVLIRSIKEINTRIPLQHRDKTGLPGMKPRPALADIMGHIDEIIGAECAQ